MAINPLQHVQPGQLITSAWANDVVDEINTLAAMLAALGSPPETPPSTSGKPVLTSRSPTGNLEVGDPITLFGQNFGPRHDGLTRVAFGPVQISDSQFLFGSSDTQLRFAVPNITPATVTVKVITPEGTSDNALSVTVLPTAVENLGDVQVDAANDPDNPPTPTEGVPLLLQWKVASNTEHPDHYTFHVDFTDVTPASQVWSALLNTDHAMITPGSPFTVVATVTVPHEGTATVTLTAQSTTDTERKHTSTPLSLEVDAEMAVSDPRIELNVAVPQPIVDSQGHPSHAHLSFEDGKPVISVDADSDSFVRINVHFNDPLATIPVPYRFFAEVDDTTNWTVGTVQPPTLIQSALMGNTHVTYNLTNEETGSEQNNATLTVRAAKLQSVGGPDDYISFAPVTLRNAG
jgi:IPT/TIG domain